MAITNRKLYFYSTKGYAESSYVPTAGVWTHVAFVNNTTNNTIYINGAYHSVLNVGIGSQAGAVFTIGALEYAYYPTMQSYQGYIDELAVYSSQLTATEIQKIYLDQLRGIRRAIP